MTTHELARLLETLKDGFGPSLKNEAAKEFGVAAEAFRSLPEKSLKDFIKDHQKLAAGAGDGVAAIIDRVRALRESGGPADTVMTAVNKLKAPELKEVLKAFGQQGKGTTAENKARIRGLLAPASIDSSAADAGSSPSSEGGEITSLIEDGYREYCRLRDASDLTIAELRARFASFRKYPRPVLEGITRRLGYQPRGGKEELANWLLETLERMRISQMRGEIIGSAS